MPNELKHLAQNYEHGTRQVSKPNNAKEPMLLQPKAFYPFEKVNVDIFELYNKHQLVTVDCFSNLLKQMFCFQPRIGKSLLFRSAIFVVEVCLSV